MSEEINTNQGVGKGDLRDLHWKTLEAIDDVKDRVRPEDKAKVQEEMLRRIDEEDYSDDKQWGGLARDLVSHGYGLDTKGQLLYPTPETIESIKNGLKRIPRGETLEERAERLESETKEKLLRRINTPKSVAGLAIKNVQPRRLLVSKTNFPAPAKRALQKKEDDLNKIYGYNDGDDLFIRASEPLMIQMLGQGSANAHFITERDTRVMWATKYDDYVNSTDIIYEMESPVGETVNGRKIITLSLDVTTATVDKTNKGIHEKFDDSGYHRVNGLQWTKRIECCGNGNKTRSENDAPHFIIGLSRKTFYEIADDFKVNKDGFLEDNRVRPDIEFMVASEIYEQALMQLAFIPKGKLVEHSEKLQDVRDVMERKLAKMLGYTSEYNSEEFQLKYWGKIKQLAGKDEAFRLTVNEARSNKRIGHDIYGR